MSIMFGESEDFNYFVDVPSGVVVAKFNKPISYCKTEDEVWLYRAKEILRKLCESSERVAKVDGIQDFADGGNYAEFRDVADRYLKHIALYGKAKCSKEDTFDPEVGKKIAREKLLAKYYKFERHMVNYVLQKIVRFFGDYHVSLLNRSVLCAYKINKYTGERKGNNGKEHRD